MATRWDEWFSEDNLSKDERILSARPSQAAADAARIFLAQKTRFILDLACGVGRDTFYLESQGLDVMGVDASFNGIRTAQRVKLTHVARAAFVTADARSLPFPDSSFDGVYCFGLLHEFTTDRKEKDVQQVMREIGRLLDDEGVLVLSVLSGEPEAGLPDVQLFSRPMFETATEGWHAIEVKLYDDVGCTGRPDYHVWYGVFQKAGGRRAVPGYSR